jgi:hypothetical protein
MNATTPIPGPPAVPSELRDTLPPDAEDRVVTALSRLMGKVDRILVHLGLPLEDPERTNGHAVDG